MSLKLTEKRLAAVYECLRAFAPFCGWKLPPADKVQFIVAKTRNYVAAHCKYAYTDHHIIEVSEKMVGHFDGLAVAMAHEMIHMHQKIRRTTTPNTEHNAEWHKMAKRICRRFGWDEKAF